jgi:hypothetical protein
MSTISPVVWLVWLVRLVACHNQSSIDGVLDRNKAEAIASPL